MASENDFNTAKQRAIERMKEMNDRAINSSPHKMPPAPSFVRVNRKESDDYQNTGFIKESPVQKKGTVFDGILNNLSSGDFSNIPVLNRLKSDPDTLLILGMILILSSDSKDKLLLIAMLYILT